MVAQEQVMLEHCKTTEELADILTEDLSRENFVYFRHLLLGVMEFESRGGAGANMTQTLATERDSLKSCS